MPFVLAAALGLLIGLALGGRPRNFAGLQLRAWPLLVLPAAFRGLQFVAGEEASWLQPAIPFVFPGELVLLLLFAALNFRIIGLPVIAAGAGLNALVVSLNGGRMPIPLHLVSVIGGRAAASSLAAAGHAGDYVLLGSGTRLWWLGDVLLMPGPLTRALSAGDVLIMVGLVLAVAAAMVHNS